MIEWLQNPDIILNCHLANFPIPDWEKTKDMADQCSTKKLPNIICPTPQTYILIREETLDPNWNFG